LEIVALVRHATLDGADAPAGVQPRTEIAEHGQVGVDAGRLQRDEDGNLNEALLHLDQSTRLAET